MIRAGGVGAAASEAEAQARAARLAAAQAAVIAFLASDDASYVNGGLFMA
jgi:hypothetical protein